MLQPSVIRAQAGTPASIENDASDQSRRCARQNSYVRRTNNSMLAMLKCCPARLQGLGVRCCKTASSSTTSGIATAAAWDPDDYMHSYDSDDYDDSTYFQLHTRRKASRQQAQTLLFKTSADRDRQKSQEKRKVTAHSARVSILSRTCCSHRTFDCRTQPQC